MMSIAQDSYLESRILSADGVELVQILYQAALESVEKARRYLQEGEIAARSREITRATAVIAELAVSLDRAAGDLSRNLLELYDYMQRKLIEANFHQSDPILAEVSRLLATLLEGWMHCNPVRELPEPPYAMADPEPEYGRLVAVNY